ncbi:MAG TPA: aminoacyl-tRNA hydrolase [Thermoplasmata archaeon]|nr:aminoacyl-tRNA hydrolase [Thermoplasmata archaeon]
MRATDPAGYKMVLVVRGELRLTPGKAAVQVAHAAVLLALGARGAGRSHLDRWVAEGQKKIAVVAESLAEMQAIERKARAIGIATAFVEDAGFTEVPPGTRTVLGLGPARASEIDRLTGSLPLL